jgi:hypothetical protein
MTKTPYNIGLPQWGLTCFYDSSVLNQSAMLLLNFCAKNPPLRQAEKRQTVKKPIHNLVDKTRNKKG